MSDINGVNVYNIANNRITNTPRPPEVVNVNLFGDNIFERNGPPLDLDVPLVLDSTSKVFIHAWLYVENEAVGVSEAFTVEVDNVLVGSSYFTLDQEAVNLGRGTSGHTSVTIFLYQVLAAGAHTLSFKYINTFASDYRGHFNIITI